MMESKKQEPVEQPTPPEEHSPFAETARRVLLAGIGAVALAQEEIEDFIKKLVERGEIAEKDGKRLIREIVEKRKRRAEKAEEEFSRRVESILERMNLPSKAEIEALSEKINALSKKIDELRKS